MSGGGSYGGGGGGGGDEPLQCEDLRFKTSLASPVPAIVVKLKVGDELFLTQDVPDGPVLAKNANGKTAGSIAGSRLLQLLKCMNGGHGYHAKVISISGGNVEVEIKHD